MEFFNFHVSVMDDERFAAAEPIERSAWLHLIRYCIGQENGGRIEGCRNWSNKKWQIVCRVSQKEVLISSELWSWEGDDLLLWAYPSESQNILKTKREAGRRGGLATTEAKTKAVRENGALGGRPITKAEPKQNLSETKGVLGQEPNVREGKGMEGKENIPEGDPKAQFETYQVHPRILAINSLKGRRDDTVWSKKEFAVFEALGLADLADDSWADTFEPLAAYYAAPLPQLRRHWGQAPDGTADYRRRDIQTLLNNWAGEVDRARAFCIWVEKIRAESRVGLLVGDPM